MSIRAAVVTAHEAAVRKLARSESLALAIPSSIDVRAALRGLDPPVDLSREVVIELCGELLLSLADAPAESLDVTRKLPTSR